MRKEIFELLKKRPLTAGEVVQKLAKPSGKPANYITATLQIMVIEKLLTEKRFGQNLKESVYGWPKKVEGKL